MNNVYDVCFVCFEEVKSDARTLNLVRTYAKHGKSVAIVAPIQSEDISELQELGVDVFPMAMHPQKSRFIMKWFRFSFAARKYRKIKAKVYWANDFYSLYVAWKFHKSNGGKLFYDSREIYSALGPLADFPAKQAVITAIERRLVSDVDKIIVSGIMDEEYLRGHFTSHNDYALIMNLPPYRPKTESNLIRKELGISASTKIIIYQGVILKGRGILPVFRALQSLENCVFVIFGSGPRENEFRALAKSLNVDDRVYFFGKVPYNELHNYTSSADLGVSFIEPITLSYRLALPNKLFEYCMARIPVLASDLPAIREIFNEFPVGELVPVGATPQEFVQAIKRLIERKETYVNACDEAAQICCYDRQEDGILKLLA